MSGLPPLKPRDFAAFFDELWGYAPFPWQRRLLNEVAERGRWPQTLGLPTGTGKTAAIDVAVFHLALEANVALEARAAAMRTLFVVDRRLVVDDAFRRAERIAQKLQEALAGDRSGVLHRVAARLRALTGDDTPPLRVARLRGGTPRDTDWAASPAQPLVCVSTVDQVGSRLLFRGYGVSNSMKPVHAGLLGGDCLYLLDEVHLSKPFDDTLAALSRLRTPPWVEQPIRLPFQTVRMSATPGGHPPDFQLDEVDRRSPYLGRRTGATKPTALVEARGSYDQPARLVEQFVTRALDLLDADARPVVAVVVNRVKLARMIFERLEALTKRSDTTAASVATALLIGPTRPLERDRTLDDLLDRMRCDPDGKRKVEGGPLIVVATQCIEAGADLDFDALVTEAAPLDALRQRFGRLNRTGRALDAQAVVIAPKAAIAKKADDPLYGPAVRETWTFLNAIAQDLGAGRQTEKRVDFGIDAFDPQLAATPEACRTPQASAPTLLPTYLEAWSQTSPIPAADPAVALFLHGPSRASDVQIVWRCDITAESVQDQDSIVARVAALPPSSLEALSVPVWAARRWLVGDPAAAGAIVDAEGARVHDDGPWTSTDDGATGQRRALRWRGIDDDDTRVIEPRRIRPGDVLIVPASYGGCDRWGWNPASQTDVADLAEQATLRQRGRLALRLAPEVYAAACRALPNDAPEPPPWSRIAEAIATGDKAASLANRLLDTQTFPDLPEDWRATLGALKAHQPRFDTGYGPDDEQVALLIGRQKVSNEQTGKASTEGDRGLFGDYGQIPLERHLHDVERLARLFAVRLSLPAERVADLALAGSLHDLGKEEPRFQVYLHGGDEIAAVAGDPIAKSGTRPTPRQTRRARERARLPDGARHEAWSVHMARAKGRLDGAHDAELVLWLVGTHHGHGRPFFPAAAYPEADETPDGRPPIWRLDADWPGLFARLRRRYGAHGLALMEAILRLADHRVSEGYELHAAEQGHREATE